jgi:PhzF family phenazine biosynthesis protein
MGTPLAIVDAFTAQSFGGNPAAVCVLARAADEDWMQRVAAEMNLAETAFLAPRADGWALRWFTPVVEVPLCGHATLASAHFLWESGRLPPGEPAVFHTRASGVLRCTRSDGWIHMDFPARPVTAAPLPAGVAAALGAAPAFTGAAGEDFLVELADAAAVRKLAPEHAALARLLAAGVVVTAPGDDGYDVVSRYFAPGYGITEDPVTGAAHCMIAPHWSARLGRTELRCWQASRRGGEVRVRHDGERVRLTGQAVTTLRGELA